MKAAIIRWSVIVAVLAAPLVAAAQDSPQTPRVGYLLLGTEDGSARIRQAFVDGLHDVGYVDGRNIDLDFRYSAGDAAHLEDAAKALVSRKVNVIVTGSTPAFLAAQKATSKIPIVFATIPDPVAAGFADSLSRPGRNFTGLTTLSEELNAKRLELIKEMLPTAKRVGMLENPDNPSTPLITRGIEAAAVAIGLTVVRFDVRGPEGYGAVFDAMKAQRVDAVLVLDDARFSSNRLALTAAAGPRQLPLICAYAPMAEAGCLCSYGINFLENFRRSAVYVAKILKGANPADLPIENPRQFQTVINLQVAAKLGLTVPELVRLRADRLIQ